MDNQSENEPIILHGFSSNVWFAPERWIIMEGRVRLFPAWQECGFVDERIVIYDCRKETAELVAEIGTPKSYDLSLMKQVKSVVQNSAHIVISQTGKGEAKGCRIELCASTDEPRVLFAVTQLSYGGSADWSIGWDSSAIWKYGCFAKSSRGELSVVMASVTDKAHGMVIDNGKNHRDQRAILSIYDTVKRIPSAKPFEA